MVGGPMYYLQYGVGSRVLAVMFAVFIAGVACFGIGTFTQVNAILERLKFPLVLPREMSAVVLDIGGEW